MLKCDNVCHQARSEETRFVHSQSLVRGVGGGLFIVAMGAPERRIKIDIFTGILRALFYLILKFKRYQ